MTTEVEERPLAGVEPEVGAQSSAGRGGWVASSASIEVLATGMGTLGALGAGVESPECPPTSISILFELDSEKAGLSVSSFLPLEIVVWP